MGVSAIFHSKYLHNDEGRSASSPLLGVKNDRLPTVIMLLHSVPFISPCKSFVAQIPAPFKFPAMQRNDGRGPGLREMRLREVLNVFFPERMRRIASAIAKRTFARGKTNREKSGKRPPKSPLYQAALA